MLSRLPRSEVFGAPLMKEPQLLTAPKTEKTAFFKTADGFIHLSKQVLSFCRPLDIPVATPRPPTSPPHKKYIRLGPHPGSEI